MDSIRILGKNWSINWPESGSIAHVNHGEIDYTKQEISISANQHNDQKMDTLLHEVLHAIDFTLSLGLSEAQVHALTSSLMAVLRDNPELALELSGMEWVYEDEDDEE